MTRPFPISGVFLSLFLGSAGAPLACAPDASAPRQANAIDLSSGFARPMDSDAVRAAVTPPTDAAPQQAQQVLALVRDQGVRVFLAEPPPEYLNEIELSFFAAGAVLELADLYLEAVEVAGEASPLRPRLAWLYQRLGLSAEALAHSERALRARPDDAQAHFVHGFLLGQDPDASDETLARVATHFERALALDAGFVGPGGVDAATLRRELRALRQR